MSLPSFLNQISRITDNLYLSSFMGTTEYNLLKFRITCVISACRETPKVNMKGIESIKLEVQDKPTEFLAKYFDFIADKINEVVKKNGIVLVHCVAGISRSTSMILAYLMKHKRMRLRDAHALVRSKRSFIRPNLGFWKQLIDYEVNLFGTNSVKIIPSGIGPIPDIYENEVKNMQFFNSPVPAHQQPQNQAPLQQQQQQTSSSIQLNKPIMKSSYTDLSMQGSGAPLALIPQASKISPRQAPKQKDRFHYTTTYNASYQKP